MSRTRNRKRNGGKVIAIIIAVVLSLAAGGCAGAWGVGFALTGEANPAKWALGKNNISKTPRLLAVDENGTEMYSYTKYELPEGIMFFSTSEIVPAAVLTLTVELNAAFAEYINEPLTFPIEWAATIDEEYGYASYYIYLTPIDNGESVNIEVAQSFESPITLTASLSTNPEIKASCKLDFVRRIDVEDESNAYYFAFNGNTVADKDFVRVIASEYGCGSVVGECKDATLTIELTTDFIKRFQSHLKFDAELKSQVAVEADYYWVYKDGLSRLEFTLKENINFNTFINNFDDFSVEQQQAIIYAWHIAYLEDTDNGNAEFRLNFNFKYKETVINSYSVLYLNALLTAYRDYCALDVDLVLGGSYVI